MVQRRANRPQQYMKTLKETAIKVKELRILRTIKPTVQGAKAKLKILAEKDV